MTDLTEVTRLTDLTELTVFSCDCLLMEPENIHRTQFKGMEAATGKSNTPRCSLRKGGSCPPGSLLEFLFSVFFNYQARRNAFPNMHAFKSPFISFSISNTFKRGFVSPSFISSFAVANTARASASGYEQ